MASKTDDSHESLGESKDCQVPLPWRLWPMNWLSYWKLRRLIDYGERRNNRVQQHVHVTPQIKDKMNSKLMNLGLAKVYFPRLKIIFYMSSSFSAFIMVCPMLDLVLWEAKSSQGERLESREGQSFDGSSSVCQVLHQGSSLFASFSLHNSHNKWRVALLLPMMMLRL